ncbi:MAG: hypothetical protein RSG86_06725, partial [Oscillospiraceae bacterium]
PYPNKVFRDFPGAFHSLVSPLLRCRFVLPLFPTMLCYLPFLVNKIQNLPSTFSPVCVTMMPSKFMHHFTKGDAFK